MSERFTTDELAWHAWLEPVDPETARRNVPTGIEAKLFDSLGRTLTTVPPDLEIHKTLARVIDAKRKMSNSRWRSSSVDSKRK